ncbi:MAG: hypothetical protein IPO09_16555 [Anaeromyxobacter sp.]|nr:hypothetical protein [Anaeromyxobacter sp.]MBL0276032.1 hypothetical protein [Anaeromyxobacter sp.]
MAVDPAETAFLVAAAARGEEGLAGLVGLAGLSARLPVAVGAVLAAAGIVLLVAGARWRRPMGLLGGAAVGALAALAAAPYLEARWPGLPRPALAAAGAAALAVLGVAFPPLVTFAAGALPGAVLGAAVPIAGSTAFGLLAGGLATGAVALLVADLTARALASLLGAALAGAGLLALVAASAAPEARELAARPFLLLAWLLVVGAAGVAAQRGRTGGAGRGRGGAAVSPPDRPAARAARSPGSPP